MAEVAGKEGERKTMEIRQRKKGGIKTMPFILANELCDRFASTGFSANMITYLMQQLHMPMVQASNTLTNFGGTSSLTPIIGALIADSFAGRFWTITVASTIYTLGMLSLTLTAVLPGLRPPPCAAATASDCQKASSSQLFFLYASLLLMSLGTGGIRPCVVPFGADQFEFDGPQAQAKGRRSKFFNIYFFCVEMAVLGALTVVVYVQDNVGWGWGLGIPTITMAMSVVAFVGGFPMYVRMKPGGSPITRIAQVVVAAMRKRKATPAAEVSSLYEDKDLDADISTTGRLLHTNQLKFLDRAAMVMDGDMSEEESGRPNLWRLSTVHRVEELKSIIRMLPIWAVAIVSVMSASHNYSFAIQQARTMDRRLSPHSHFQIPAATLSIFSVITTLVSLAFYDRVFVPLMRRFTGRPSGITYLQRMGIGLAISMTANIAAALVEVKRKASAADHGLLDKPSATVPISVFWMVPQYAIQGLAGAFTSVGHMEFLYDQAPESMRSTAAALFWLAISAGNYLGTLFVTLVQNNTGKRSGHGWLQDNINRGRLEYYYLLVTGLQILNLVYYIICASFYTYKPLENIHGNLPPALDPNNLNNKAERENQEAGLAGDDQVKLERPAEQNTDHDDNHHSGSGLIKGREEEEEIRREKPLMVVGEKNLSFINTH